MLTSDAASSKLPKPRGLLSISHSHLNNLCNKWRTDGISKILQTQNWTISHQCLLVVMVVPREEGLGLSFPCRILITRFGHCSSLYSVSSFIFYSWPHISQDTAAEQLKEFRVFSWRTDGIGTNPSGWAVLRPHLLTSESGGHQAAG